MSTPPVSPPPERFVLAGDFDLPTMDQWRAAATKVLNRKRPPDKLLSAEQALGRLIRTTVDGLTIRPLYTRDDGPTDLGYPGVVPFTRGTTIRRGQKDAWDVRPLHEDPDAAFTRTEVLGDLERGATSLWFRLDPDAIDPADLRTVLGEVLLDLVKVDVSSRTDPYGAAETLLEIYVGSDRPADELALNLGLDPIGHAALHGTTADLSGMVDWVRRLEGHPRSRAFVIDATIWHDAGAGDVHEVAWALATGVEYVRALLSQGADPDEAFASLNFRVTATCDEFATITRLRALRRCWSRVGEVFHVASGLRGARQHAVSSWREITRDDPYVNILRGTIATFGAAVGGAEAVTVLPFDTARGLPSGVSRRIARNTQVILAEESNIGRVNDPAGGSWYVESLTDQLADAAWQELQRVEAAGGMAAALAEGLPAEVLDRLTTERASRLAHRKQPITGVSEFPNTAEPRLTVRPRPAAPDLGGLTRHRDSEVFEGLRDRVAAAAEQTGVTPAVFLACLGARREFGPREGFAGNLFRVAGLATSGCEGGSTEEVVAAWRAAGTPVAVLCSSAKVYAAHGLEVARALKEAGAVRVLLAGAMREFGEAAEAAASVVDGTVALGVDVVEILTGVLDLLGTPETKGVAR